MTSGVPCVYLHLQRNLYGQKYVCLVFLHIISKLCIQGNYK